MAGFEDLSRQSLRRVKLTCNFKPGVGSMIVEFGHPMIQLLNCLSVPIPGTLHFLLRHPFLRLFLVLIAPTGEWRSFIDNIAYCPEHALLVSFFGDVVIWADDVELIICNLLFHVGSHLLGRPCACRLLFGGARNIARLEPVSLKKQGVTKIRPEHKKSIQRMPEEVS